MPGHSASVVQGVMGQGGMKATAERSVVVTTTSAIGVQVCVPVQSATVRHWPVPNGAFCTPDELLPAQANANKPQTTRASVQSVLLTATPSGLPHHGALVHQTPAR